MIWIFDELSAPALRILGHTHFREAIRFRLLTKPFHEGDGLLPFLLCFLPRELHRFD